MFSDAHEALRQISCLRQQLDAHVQLFNRLNVDQSLDYSIPNLIHLLQQKIETCERKMFLEEFKRTTLMNDVTVANKHKDESTKRYDELIPLVKTMTQQISQLNKEKNKLQQQYIASANEVVSLKRERDAAVHGIKEKKHELSLEQEKRQKLRGVYRILNTSFNEVSPPSEVKEALNELQKTLMN